MGRNPRVAIVHDWLNQNGGAERVLEVLKRLYPTAPIYTSFYAPDALPESYRQWDIRSSFMQRLPLAKRYYQPFLPLYPLAFDRFDLSDYDIVISNSSGFCHAVRSSRSTCHVNYCLTPPRFLWTPSEYLEREQVSKALRAILMPMIGFLRQWDARAVAERVDHFVGISRAVSERIQRCYSRPAAVIYPPVETRSFAEVATKDVGDYFLIVGRLIPYKRVDLAVRAFGQLGLPLLVVGEGRARRQLEEIATPNVKFLGRRPFEEVRRLVAGCRAFIFPGEEDFGIAPVEAQAAGRPVIAYAAGGALDTVVDGETGKLFWEQTPDALASVVRSFREADFDPDIIQRHAARFDTSVFESEFASFVQEKAGGHLAGVLLEAE